MSTQTEMPPLEVAGRLDRLRERLSDEPRSTPSW